MTRPGSELIQVDLRIPSRVESILLTSTTGFVDLSRFYFKLTWKRLIQFYFHCFLQYWVWSKKK